jgi:hypothetical protein
MELSVQAYRFVIAALRCKITTFSVKSDVFSPKNVHWHPDCEKITLHHAETSKDVLGGFVLPFHRRFSRLKIRESMLKIRE